MRSPSQPLVPGHDDPVLQHADPAIYIWGGRIACAIRVTRVARRHQHRHPDPCTGGRMRPPKPSSIGRCVSHPAIKSDILFSRIVTGILIMNKVM